MEPPGDAVDPPSSELVEPPEPEAEASAAPAPVPVSGEEEGEQGLMLHRLVDAEDPVEDATAGIMLAAAAEASATAEAGEEEEGGQEESVETAGKAAGKPQQPARAVLVGRPTPSVVHLGAALLDRATGVLSALRFNLNRDAGPLDITLLKAR